MSFRLTLLLPLAAVGFAALTPSKPAPHIAGPNYSSDVAPILNRSCVKCHRPGAVAPFSLVGYENAKKWAPMIAEVTGTRRMPPWKARAGFGTFLDESRLSDSEISLLKRWLDTGAARGEASKEPIPPVFESSWPLGEPDLILQPDRPYKIPSEGLDSYRSFVLKHTFKERTWLRAVAFDPGNDRSVHHMFAFLDAGESARNLEKWEKDGQPGFMMEGGSFAFLPSGVIGVWGPGTAVRETPPGTAYLIEPGSTVVLQVHYQTTGKAETDLTRLGLYFAKEPVQKEMKIEWVFNFDISIPAGQAAHEEVQVHELEDDIVLYGALPHMHLLGKSMKAEVEFPSGERRPLVWVEDWDMKWQLLYEFKEPVRVPKGSKIIVTAVYDNSAGNARNPNVPPKKVKYGNHTNDEMFLIVFPCTVEPTKP